MHVVHRHRGKQVIPSKSTEIQTLHGRRWVCCWVLGGRVGMGELANLFGLRRSENVNGGCVLVNRRMTWQINKCIHELQQLACSG